MKFYSVILSLLFFCINTCFSQGLIDTSKIIFEATGGELNSTKGLYDFFYQLFII